MDVHHVNHVHDAEEGPPVRNDVAADRPIVVGFILKPWEYELHGTSLRSALVRSRGRPGIEKICELLSTHRRSGSPYWSKVAKLLEYRFHWPDFEAYMQAIRTEGDRLRNGAKRLRELNLPLSRTFGYKRQDYDARLALYAESVMRPLSDERQASPIDPVRLFESGVQNLVTYFNLSNSLSTAVLGLYLEHASTSTRLQVDLPNGAFGHDECQALMAAGLLINLAEAPIELMLERLPLKALYEPILARRIKLEERSREWTGSFYREHMDPAFEFALRNSPAAGDCHVFMPPTGQTWDQLQDFRSSYSQMADMLSDWLLGRRIPKAMEALVSMGSADRVLTACL